ncbi:bifunctional tRNA (mnm(5)s(2)U34)-methyltransferase/FAD-dependent cmnm(5)s(2)U34 oxidoreductase [compost metagenome]
MKTAIVIGAGIVGLGTARALAIKGYKVKVFERGSFASGASVRNFGMIWPVGQPQDTLYERALRTKSIWKEIAGEAGIWYDEVGSMHVAYQKDELAVIEEFVTAEKGNRPLKMLTPEEVKSYSPAAVQQGLLGGVFSADEMIVESRVAVHQVAAYLQKKFDVEFYWDTAISSITYPTVISGTKSWSADHIFICNGVDFETLYPETFSQAPITKCKLQMMRLEAQDENWRIGPALCGALSLTHYQSFKIAPSLAALKERIANQYPEMVKWGIHVMVSQNHLGELTIGDSHEYGLTFDPFDSAQINQYIMDYLKTFADFKNWNLQQSWNGIYAKMTNGATEFIHSPEQGVTIINAPGGAGMTLSFGLTEEVVGDL